MKQRIVNICLWILRKCGLTVLVVPADILAIIPQVREVVEATAAMPGLLSNEYRHAHTYATLRKRLPDVPSRTIGLAIEAVIYGIF